MTFVSRATWDTAPHAYTMRTHTNTQPYAIHKNAKLNHERYTNEN